MSGSIFCRSCHSEKYCKDGHVRKHQRYLCKECGCHFTAVPDGRSKRGKPASIKALTVYLYGVCNMTYGMLGRLFDVSEVSIYRWIRSFGEQLPEPQVSANTRILILDEMWHYVDGKKTKLGSGEPMMLISNEWSPGKWAHVMMQPVPDYWKKQALKESFSFPMTGVHTTG